MGYKVQFAATAERQFGKLDKPVQRRIESLVERIESLADPRTIGEALHGDTLGEYWKYRAGDWRLRASIHDKLVLIEVVEILHRSKAY